MQTNQAGWLFVAHIFISLNHGYPKEFFCKGIWLSVSMVRLLHTNVEDLKGKKNVPFADRRETKFV